MKAANPYAVVAVAGAATIGAGGLVGKATVFLVGGMGDGSGGAIPLVSGLAFVALALVILGVGLVVVAAARGLVPRLGLRVTRSRRLGGLAAAIATCALASVLLLTGGLQATGLGFLLLLALFGITAACAPSSPSR